MPLIPALIAAVLMLSLAAAAQTPGKLDLEAAELAAELIGRPVHSADGVEVGTVNDLSFDDQGQPDRLRIDISRHLGFGSRTVEVPPGAFMTLRGAVVLDLPADGVQALPEVTGPHLTE